MNKKSCTQLTLFLVILLTGSVLAQEPGITWTKLYKPTCDGCIAAAMATDGTQLPDGGYLAAGFTVSPYTEPYLVRTNSSGDTLWTHHYPTELTGFAPVMTVNVKIANDGNYFLCAGGLANEGQRIGLLKVNTNGDLLWSRYFTEGAYDTLYVTTDMKLTPDGGVIISGIVQPGITIERDAFLCKFTADGSFEWYRKFGSYPEITAGWSVENALDGGYILCCTYDNLDSVGITRLRLIKTDNLGEPQWSVLYPLATLESVGEFPCIIRTNDNNYVISGEAFNDYFLMKVDLAGGIIWLHSYGFPSSGQLPHCVAQTTDGGYIIIGIHTPDGTVDDVIYVVKTNNNGVEEWSKQIFQYFQSQVHRVHPTLDNGYLIYGSTRTELGGMDYLMMIKLGGTFAIEDQETAGNSAVIRNYPNPVTSETTIQYFLPSTCPVSIKVFDITGNEIMTLTDHQQSKGNHEVRVNSQNIPAGIYYYRLNAGTVNSAGRMIVIK